MRPCHIRPQDTVHHFDLRLRSERSFCKNKMANIFILPVDVFLYILRYLDIHDRIAFALTCRMFRQICVDEGVFRKMDFSRGALSRRQRGEISKFIMHKQLTQQIRELNLSNLRALNWHMNDHLEEFIMLTCCHLESLHILNCGVSFRRLLSILKQAPKLTALSWSLLDFTTEDIQFVVNSIDLSEGICLRSIKHLRLQMKESNSHIQIAKYLVLSCCRDLEELEIHTWSIDIYNTGRNFPVAEYKMIPGFPEPSEENELQHLHSLMVVPVGSPLSADYKKKLSKFVISVLKMRSSLTKWRKLWVSPSIDISIFINLQFPFHEVYPCDIQAVEVMAAHAGWSGNIVDKLKSFFERISDNTVRSLHLCLPDEINSSAELYEHISRVGGYSLKFLRLTVHYEHRTRAEQNVFIHTLFSNCLNIKELDLLECCFHKDICEPLSELKHLTKVQLKQCAISSKHCRYTQVEISKANLLTFVENCKNITHLHVRGCSHQQFSFRLTDDDLLALAKLRNLKSLTLYYISGITEWTFLKNISEHCKFLTTLRISDWKRFENSHIPMLMECAKFLKHLAINMPEVDFGSELFWNLLSLATNLERLCIRCGYIESLNVSVAVKTLKSLPRLHVVHLHSHYIENEDFYNEMMRVLEEKKSDCKFSFEIVMENRMNTWINHETGYSLISNKALPVNRAELCNMTPILAIPRF